MLYYRVTVKQMLDRKGKPWRATAYFHDANGDRRTKSRVLREAKGKREAQRLADEWLTDLNKQAEKEAPANKEGTVSETIQAYEDFRLNNNLIEKSSYKRDLLITKNYINPYLGDYYFTDVTRADINGWVTKLYQKYKPTTVKNAFSQLKKVYTYYSNIDEITTNPFKGVKTPSQGEPKVTHLDKDQKNKFHSAVLEDFDDDTPMLCGCLLALYGGLRRGEICALRWHNIDFDKGTITIDSAVGYGSGGNYTKGTKNKSSERTFPMMPQLYEALKEEYDRIKPEGHWYVTGNKDKFMSLQSFTDKFHRLVERHNLVDAYGKPITPHGLRHNFATEGINSGMDIASLSKMMGHASRAMTLDTYGDATPDALQLAVDKLALKFSNDSELATSDETAEKLYAIEQKLKVEK